MEFLVIPLVAASFALFGVWSFLNLVDPEIVIFVAFALGVITLFALCVFLLLFLITYCIRVYRSLELSERPQQGQGVQEYD